MLLFFAATDETVCTVRALYFRSRIWIIEGSGQQCVLQSASTDLSATRERPRRVSVMSDHELLFECWWAVWWHNPNSWQQPRLLWFVLATAYRVATWLPLPPISLGYTQCIHSRSVIEFHTCHCQLNCVFCKVHVLVSWYAEELSWWVRMYTASQSLDTASVSVFTLFLLFLALYINTEDIWNYNRTNME